jgi:beta-glucosidase
MKAIYRLFVILFCVSIATLIFHSKQANSERASALPPYCNPRLSIDQRVADLLSRMTLEEKVAQTRCIWQMGRALRDEQGNFSPAKAQELMKNGMGEIGTIAPPAEMPKPADGARFVNAVQKFLIENTRLGIPAIVHGEALHGFMARDATNFPQAIALASTWDVDLVHQVFTVAAAEARARGTHQVFTPVLDVGREPRWGRTEETYGEDPYLASRMGVACITGFQGLGPNVDSQHVVATTKHFAGYGWSEGGRNTAPSNHSERVYRQIILPPFQAGITEAGALGVMASYNEIDGIPAHANKWLLRRILREEWGFRGLVVSDYGAVEELISSHHVAADCAEAAKRALEAGVDVETPEGTCYATLVRQIIDGRVAESTLDQSVARVLRTKFLLGLFDNPYVDPENAERVCRLPEHRELALKAAQEAIILLKNENHLLPLNRDKMKSIAVIGPNAATIRLGEYGGVPAHAVSILDGIKEKAGGTIKVSYALGCGITAGNRDWWDDKVEFDDPKADAKTIAEAVAVAKTADVAVVAVGDNEQTSREAFNEQHLGDRDSLDLVGQQDDLVKAIVATGKPVVVILINGRPASIRYIADNVPAILEGWSLGQETGTAVADVLFGDYNPGGKLPITIPRSVGQLPAYYDHEPSAERGYLLATNRPLFPFGYGLSYTTSQYENLRVSPEKIGPQGQTAVKVDVTNTGNLAGDAVVELYICDQVSSVARPVKELKGFQRIRLQPGEKRTVDFLLTSDALAFYNEDMHRVVEPGVFKIMVGASSDEVTTTDFQVTNP